MTCLFFISNYVMLTKWSVQDLPFDIKFNMIWESYLEYIKLIFTKWDWGATKQFAFRVPVWELVKPKMKLTIGLNLIAFVLYIVIGIVLGVIAAIKKNSFVDQLICSVTTFFNSLPSFVLILILILVLGYWLKWFPPIVLPLDAELYYFSLSIPLIALILPQLSQIALLVRGEIIELREAEFIILAKAKGLSNYRILIRHILRNALVPIVPTLSQSFMTVMISSVFIERTANLPGLANLFLKSIFVSNNGSISYDTPVVILVCLIYSGIAMTITLLLDVLYRFIDPHVRIGTN